MGKKYDYAISVSCGNDSVAMTQFLIENVKKINAVAIYCNTGWGSSEWPDRVEKFKEYCQRAGIDFIETFWAGGGMEQVSIKKKMFPLLKSKWCTDMLKIRPFNHVMGVLDPDCESTVCVGVRREESLARRNFPEFSTTPEGREKWAPIFDLKSDQRNDLINRAGFEILPHRSRECAPCIHSSKADLRTLQEPEIARLEALEKKMGEYFFYPNGRMGAEGIRQVVDWSRCERGKYVKSQLMLDFDRLKKLEESEIKSCDSGFCGD